MLLREAIEKTKYDWKHDGDNLPAAMLAILQRTGTEVLDPATKLIFRRLDLCAALDHVFAQVDSSAQQAIAEDVEQKLTALGGQIVKADGQITQLSFKDCSKFGPAEFETIASLPKLKKLTLYGKCNGLNDETLPLLARLSELEELSSDGIMVTDRGLKALTKLPNLKAMNFFHPSWGSKDFTGAGVAQWTEMPKLERLTIAGSPFNDEGMAAVGQLTQLREFRTWHTYQTEAGNQHLLKLTNLKSLRLGQRLRKYDGKPSPPSLSDETLTVLSQLKSLESLLLDEAKLSRAALSKLQAIPNLKRLGLERIDISAEEVEQLKKDLPKVAIDWKPPTEEQRVALEKMLKP
jgi:hypothetical protein